MRLRNPEAFPDFCYVDTAIGGANKRNRVMRLDQFTPSSSAVDVYMTYARYRDDLKHYAITNPNVPPSRLPSVRGYNGPAVADSLYLDFDSADDPSLAHQDLRRALEILTGSHGVPPAQLRQGFSGKKGFWLELPAELFGGLAPIVELHRHHKALARRLFPDFHTLDFGIYTPLRLIRCVNTRHSGSGLYKIPLTSKEVEELCLSDILALAKTPR